MNRSRNRTARTIAPWLFLAWIVAPVPYALGQTSAERLGYATGSRVVMIEARDFGLSWEMNQAASTLIGQQKLVAMDVVVTGPWFPDFAEWARDHRDIDIGVSVALTNPHPRMQWRFLTAISSTSTLVDADGLPWPDVIPFATHASPEDAEQEIDAQIRRAKLAGIPVSHVSGYHGTVFSRPDLAAVFLATARKHWLPAPVVELTPAQLERFEKQGFPLDEETVRLVSNYTLPKLDDIQFAPQGNTFEEKRDRFCELLSQLKPGLTQLVLTPAVESDGLKRLTADWQQRVWEAQLLGDEKVRNTFRQQRIIITNWRRIMQRYSGMAENSSE